MLAGAGLAHAVREIAQNHVDHVRAALPDARLRDEVAVEQPRQRVLVGQEEIGEARDREIEVDGIDIGSEHTLALAFLQEYPERFEKATVKRFHPGRLLEVLPVVDVLHAHQANEVGGRDEMVEGRGDELAHAFDGRQLAQPLVLLPRPQARIDPLQDFEVERLLRAEIVVDQVLVDVGRLRDAIDPGAVEPVRDEFDARLVEDARTGRFRIADGLGADGQVKLHAGLRAMP